MDPLSLTASIIAIVGVGGEVAKAVRKLASLKDAPGLILALNNEISDLYLVILAIRDIYQRQRASFSSSPETLTTDNIVISTLTQANDKVLELKALHRRLTSRTTGSSNLNTLNKASWLRERKNVKKIQEDLHTVRLKLSAALGILNSSSLLHLKTDVQAVQSKLVEVQTHQQQSRRVQDQDLTRIERAVKEPIAQLLLSQQRIELKLNADVALGVVQAAESRTSTTTQTNWNRETVPSSAICVTAFTSHNRCTDFCVCKCHQLSTGHSPSGLNKFFGRLFFGYSGLPYLGPPCDSQFCERNNCPVISIVYFFPLWLLARAFAMTVRLSLNNGPELNIRFPRIISNSAKIFSHAVRGEVDDIHLLFRQGLASPYDIDGLNGQTALMYALEYGQVEACKVLLNAGADPYHEDLLGNSYDRVWRVLLSGRFDTETQEQLRILFPDQGFVKKQRFTLLHRTVLGLNHLDLAPLVASLPKSAIDDVDSRGRTPLFWAAVRGDFAKVSLLVEQGADVNRSTLAGDSPCIAAIVSQNLACMEKLVGLVKDVNVKGRQGWTLLHTCCYYGIHTDIIHRLLRRGADIEASVPNEGSTPIIIVAQHNHTHLGELLIAHGVKLNTITKNGESALLRAISHNSHEMIQSLLKHHADHSLKTLLGETIMHYAARYGDLKCLEVLCAADLSGVKVDDQANGLTAFQMAGKRRGVPDEWLPKFRELLDGVSRIDHQDLEPDNTEDFEDALEQQD